MKGLAPEAVDLDSETLRFHLEKSDLTDEAWADLLGQPRWGAGRFFNRPTGLSVGLADGSPVESSIDSFQLSRIDIFWFWVSFVLLAIAIGLLIILALYTEMLRDLGPSPTPDFQTRWWLFGLTINAAHKPYSLARFQMAFWFSLVVITFLYIWLINGSMNTITASVLGLIGIGAGTALGAAMIEGGKKQADNSELANLEAEETTLLNDISSLTNQISATPDSATLAQSTADKTFKINRLNVVQARLAQLNVAAEAKRSHWFLVDILTDPGNGISFHRFQMFVWTLILGMLFIYQVWSRLSMPEFDATLLALLGISSGTYLGFKIPEK